MESPEALSITFLGTGGSSGVPEIGCTCSVCLSTNSRNKRTRSSISIHHNNCRIIVDTTPDFREHMLKNGIQNIDALLITHPHADHIFGLADIRPFNFKQNGPVDTYCSLETSKHIRSVFSYIFTAPESLKHFFPQVEMHTINGTFEICGLTIIPFTVLHASMPVTAFRFHNTVYITDVSTIPEEHFLLLEELDLLILGAFRYEKHISHFSLDEAVAIAERINAKRTLFTHLSHAFDHEEVNKQLPESMSLAFDGLSISPGTL